MEKENIPLKTKKFTNILKGFILIILINSYIQKSEFSEPNLCNLKIADSLMSSFNGNDIIYNYGKIDEMRFGKDALTPYNAPFNKEIDFFYATEIHSVDLKKSHKKVVRKFP